MDGVIPQISRTRKQFHALYLVFQIKLRVVVEYLKALGAPASVGLMLSVVLYTGATIGTNIWLTAWSDDQVNICENPATV